MKAYSSISKDFRTLARDFANLFRFKLKQDDEAIRVLIQRQKEIEASLLRDFGLRLEKLDILEIGPGQNYLRMRYYGEKNHMTGIDMDVIPQGAGAAGYWRMLRSNGVQRTVKTAARKLLGLDGRHVRSFEKMMGRKLPDKFPIHCGSAEKLPFKDKSFDMVYSHSVFEHLPNPEICIKEIVRVLRPGGIFYTGIHLYTSDNGCHDPRIFAGNREGIPYWSHLRSGHQDKVQPNAYLNRLRMKEWKALFDALCPGSKYENHQYHREAFESYLQEIRQKGELQDYSADELLTVDMAVSWRKPQ